MANPEERLDKVEATTYDLKASVAALVQELRDFKDEIRDFKQEMRDRDNQRHAEIQATDAKIDAMGNHVRNITIASMVGIGAMVLASGAMAVAVIYSVFNSVPK